MIRIFNKHLCLPVMMENERGPWVSSSSITFLFAQFRLSPTPFPLAVFYPLGFFLFAVQRTTVFSLSLSDLSPNFSPLLSVFSSPLTLSTSAQIFQSISLSLKAAFFMFKAIRFSRHFLVPLYPSAVTPSLSLQALKKNSLLSRISFFFFFMIN